MTLNYDIAVDLTPEFNRQLSPKFSVSLGDHGAREYTVQILQDGEPYEIEEGGTVSIVGKKSDNHIFAYACTYFDSFVRFTIEEQMTPVSGIVTCELSIIDASGNKVGSANFTYWVEPSPVTDGEASESDLQLFQQLLDAADDLDDVREILDRAVPIAEQLGNVEKLLTAFPTEEASGSLLTPTDGADGIPAKKLTLSLSPHQSGSGDPSPDNVRAISGYDAVTVTRTGKNLLSLSPKSQTVNGVTFTINADGSVTANGTASANAFYTITGFDQMPGIAYRMTGCPSGGSKNSYLLFVGSKGDAYQDGGSGANFPVITEQEHIYIRVAVYSGVTVNNLVFYPMVRVASLSDDTFKPYQGEEYEITIPTSAGTVYGGSLEINDDGSGTLTVDKGLFDLGSITWLKSSTNPDNIFFYGVCTGKKAGTLNILSDRYVTAQRNGWTVYSDAISGNASTSQIYIRTSQYSDLTAGEFKTAVSGVYIVCDLSEPQTYTLTAEQVTTLLGDNTLWMDANGSIDLTYRADTQKYIDNRISALNANLAYIEEGMTASRAYTVGQFVLIGGQLYKVTASIASGATFTIGTNVVATTVGNELTALNN